MRTRKEEGRTGCAPTLLLRSRKSLQKKKKEVPMGAKEKQRVRDSSKFLYSFFFNVALDMMKRRWGEEKKKNH